MGSRVGLTPSFHYPSILQESMRVLIIQQIDSLASITYDVSCTGIYSGVIPHKFLQVHDIIQGRYMLINLEKISMDLIE